MENREEIKEFVRWWDNKFSIDFWYRTHYGIRFNSPEHRELTLFDMAFELEEFMIAREARDNKTRILSAIKDLDETGLWLKKEKLSDDDVEEAFDNLDLSKFNKDA